MRNNRGDVVQRAIDVLDTWGLADLSMRRLATELGVQPSALYHHFTSKQALLAAVADEVLARGARPVPGGGWDRQVVAVCTALRDALLAYRDGAELVATVRAFGLGASAPYDALVAALTGAGPGGAGLRPELAATAADTLLHFVLGHATDEQINLQAGSAGAIADGPRATSDFGLGLAIVVDGIRTLVAHGIRTAWADGVGVGDD